MCTPGSAKMTKGTTPFPVAVPSPGSRTIVWFIVRLFLMTSVNYRVETRGLVRKIIRTAKLFDASPGCEIGACRLVRPAVYATALCAAASGKPPCVMVQTGVEGNQGLCAGKSRTIYRALGLSSRGTRLHKIAGSHSRNHSPSGRKSAAVETQHPEH